MPYRVTIKSEQGQPLAGTMYFWLNGEEIGQAGISAGGSTLSDQEVEQADHYTVEAPGYSFYGTSVLYENNVFTLAQKPKTAMYVVLGLAGGFLLAKLLNFKL